MEERVKTHLHKDGWTKMQNLSLPYFTKNCDLIDPFSNIVFSMCNVFSYVFAWLRKKKR